MIFQGSARGLNPYRIEVQVDGSFALHGMTGVCIGVNPPARPTSWACTDARVYCMNNTPRVAPTHMTTVHWLAHRMELNDEEVPFVDHSTGSLFRGPVFRCVNFR